MEYDSLDKAVVGDNKAELKFDKCAKTSIASRLMSAFDKVLDPLKELSFSFTRPFSHLDIANKAEKKPIYKKIREVESQIKGADEKTKLDLENKLEDLKQQLEEIPSTKVENLTINAHNEYMLRVNTYAGDSLDKLSRVDIKGEEDKIIQNILGQENEKLTADYILGQRPDGTKLERNLLSDVKANGIEAYESGAATTGSKLFDSYIAENGIKAVDKVYTITKAFRDLGHAAGLAPEKFLKNYFSKLDGMFTDELEKMQKHYSKKFYEDTVKPFFEKKRTSLAFEANDVSIKKAISVYMNGIRRKIQSGYASEIARIRFDTGNGLKKLELDAVDQILENMNNAGAPPVKGEEAINHATNFFYRASLVNNVGSALNNLTSIPNIIMPKFGVRNTLEAFRHLNEPSYLNQVLDSFGIGHADDAVTVFSMSYKDINAIDPMLKWDVFNKSEMVSLRLASIAGLNKRFGGYDNVVKKLDSIAKMPDSKAKIDKLIEFGTIAKKAGMDTIFNNVTGNTPKSYSEIWGKAGNTAMAFLRHPTREARFLWNAIAHSADKKEAIEVTSKYFFSKAMLMGSGATTFFIPPALMDLMEKKVPEVRQGMIEVGKVLDTIAVPKMLAGQIGLDFSKTQDIAWWFQIPGKFLNAKQEIPIVRYYTGVLRSMNKIVEGKGTAKDMSKALTALAAVPGGGVVKIGGIPIGSNQLKKVGDTAVSLFTGKTEFFGIEDEIEDAQDVRDAIAAGVFSMTPKNAKVLNSKTRDPGSHRRYLISMATKGHIDKYTFGMFVDGLGGDKKKAIASLKRSIIAESGEDSKMKKKALRALRRY